MGGAGGEHASGSVVDTRKRPNKERERERERTRKKAQEMCLATHKTRSGGIYVGIYVGIYSSKTRSAGASTQRTQI